ncbi:MAG: class I SAM-dependent methyltransferase [Anaerolineales bacterium]|nr:class I SAM-dependent methyltransferase [Anaerolineales bacterium]
MSALPVDFSDVEATALLTLYGRALESSSQDPILVDEQAERIVRQIDDQIAGTQDHLLRMLYNRKIDPRLIVHIALRAQKYDQYARNFLSRYPDGVIVSLGCGMDTRFQRIDDGRMHFFDLDLPAMIRFKRGFLQETDRYQMIAASVLETGWMDQVAAARKGSPVLFIAEGLFMYLKPDQVRQLVVTMQTFFPGSEMVCEVVNQRWIRGVLGKIAAGKMQSRLKLGKGTEYCFGIASPDEMEAWSKGIHFIDRWSYFDSNHPKMGWLRIFRRVKLFTDLQYTVRYRFD